MEWDVSPEYQKTIYEEYCCTVCQRSVHGALLPFETHGEHVSSRPLGAGATFPLASGAVETVCPSCYRLAESAAGNGYGSLSSFTANYRVDPLKLMQKSLQGCSSFGFMEYMELRKQVLADVRSYFKVKHDYISRIAIYDYMRNHDVGAEYEFKGWILRFDLDFESHIIFGHRLYVGYATESDKMTVSLSSGSDVDHVRQIKKTACSEIASFATIIMRALGERGGNDPVYKHVHRAYAHDYLGVARP